MSIEILNLRQQQILSRVREQGFATIEALAKDFDVSMQTVRRDIIFLDHLDLLQRFHGGAGLRDSNNRPSYAQKQHLSANAKQRIALATAALIPERSSVFLDVGTTVEAVARALCGKTGLHVFTNSVAAALILAQQADPLPEIFLTGGRLRSGDGALVGETALTELQNFKVDYAILTCSGFDDDEGAALDFDMQKVAIKQAALKNTRHAVLVADATKFSRSALVRVATPDQFECLITDAAPPQRLAEKFEAAGIEVRVAP